MARADRTEHDELLHAVLPAALEVMTAWSLTEDGDPAEFTDAMDRVLGDAAASEDPRASMARLLFGLTSLSGILLDQLAVLYGTTRPQVLHQVNQRYLGSPG